MTDYTIARFGRYHVVEGIGPSGGLFFITCRGRIVDRCRTRADAEIAASFLSDWRDAI